MQAYFTARRSKDKVPRPSTERVSLGARFEDESIVFYERLGFHLLARNVRFKVGEIDLLFEEGCKRLLIVEVRARLGRDFLPSKTLKWKKQRRLFALARIIIQRYKKPVDIELCEWTCRVGVWNCRRFRVRE